MTFFARPDLSDIQFKQYSDSELHLSGATYFMKSDGLNIADGSGNTIPIVLTGATTGHVMTYLDGQIRLAPAGSSTDINFSCGCNQITRFSDNTVYNVNVSATTICQFLERFFFPSVPATASISATNPSRQFGDGTTGTLSYCAIRNTSQICSVGVDTVGDGVYDCSPVITTITGSCCGSTSYSFPSFQCHTPSTSGATCTSVSYGMCVTTVPSEISLDSVSVTWMNKRYYFQSNTLYDASDASTIEAIVNILSTPQAVLTTTKQASLTLTFNNQFFYYLYPTSFGTPSFTVNGLPNNAWGNSGTGTLFKIAFTNSNGYLNQYYVARSDSRITGSYTISII